MKKLYLIRHAKSSWGNLNMDDFDRPLNERGEKDAPRMGKRLKEKRVTPDFILTSPAIRAFDTCKIIAKVLGYSPEKIQTDKRLYHASEEQIWEVVRELKERPNDKEEIVLLFGHNPGITHFANKLTSSHIDNMPTCSIAACTLKINRWKEAGFGCGKMDSFDFPKDELG
jgi:phosphohistidine phosphatase